MTTGQLPVVAAIPNYNMGENLRRLLPQVLAERYDAVFVLDDASTDDSADVVSEFGDEVKFVRSPENRGAGANRNQIIDQVTDGVLIHFIDADMDLETTQKPPPSRGTRRPLCGSGGGDDRRVGHLRRRPPGVVQPRRRALGVGERHGDASVFDRPPERKAAASRRSAPGGRAGPRGLAQHAGTSRPVAHLLGPRGQHARPLTDIQVDRRVRPGAAGAGDSGTLDPLGEAGHQATVRPDHQGGSPPHRCEGQESQ